MGESRVCVRECVIPINPDQSLLSARQPQPRTCPSLHLQIRGLRLHASTLRSCGPTPFAPASISISISSCPSAVTMGVRNAIYSFFLFPADHHIEQPRASTLLRAKDGNSSLGRTCALNCPQSLQQSTRPSAPLSSIELKTIASNSSLLQIGRNECVELPTAHFAGVTTHHSARQSHRSSFFFYYSTRFSLSFVFLSFSPSLSSLVSHFPFSHRTHSIPLDLGHS